MPHLHNNNKVTLVFHLKKVIQYSIIILCINISIKYYLHYWHVSQWQCNTYLPYKTTSQVDYIKS